MLILLTYFAVQLPQNNSLFQFVFVFVILQSLPASASFRLQVDGFNKKLPQSTKVEKIEV